MSITSKNDTIRFEMSKFRSKQQANYTINNNLKNGRSIKFLRKPKRRAANRSACEIRTTASGELPRRATLPSEHRRG